MLWLKTHKQTNKTKTKIDSAAITAIQMQEQIYDLMFHVHSCARYLLPVFPHLHFLSSFASFHTVETTSLEIAAHKTQSQKSTTFFSSPFWFYLTLDSVMITFIIFQSGVCVQEGNDSKKQFIAVIHIQSLYSGDVSIIYWTIETTWVSTMQ